MYKCSSISLLLLHHAVNVLTRLTIYSDSAGNICIDSMIPTTSDLLEHVVLLHPVNDLSNITVREVNTSVQQPYCIYIGREDTYSVAVFEWTNGGIDLHPITRTFFIINIIQSNTHKSLNLFIVCV